MSTKKTKALTPVPTGPALPESFKSWYEIEPTFPDEWIPENAGDYIIGRLDTVKNGVGPNSSKVYVIKDCTTGNALTKKEEKAEGMISVWDTQLLNVRLSPFKTGDEVAILYLGKELNPKTGRTFKNLKVFRPEPF